MKNKNNINRTINEVVDLVVELKKAQGGSMAEFAHSYALGTCQGIINSAKWMPLQECINSAYNNVRTEMDAWEKGTHAFQLEKASEEYLVKLVDKS
jgi:hypothetical protein